MRFHHMALMVSDIHQATRFWRDVMGFELTGQGTIPDLPEDGSKPLMSQTVLDDIFGVNGARSKMALLVSDGGAFIELQQCEVPAIQKTPKENLRYGHTGIHELGLLVDSIDSWFKKIRQAGYETQTDYIWEVGNSRSFLFYDDDGNMIQLWEQSGQTLTWGGKEIFK